MILDFTNEKELAIPENFEQTAEKIADAVLRSEKCPYTAEVSLTIVDDEEIREMNRSYREIDRVTDVLSFPMIDFGTPADFSILSEGDPEQFDPDTGALTLGDVVISSPQAFRQAEAYGHSALREFSFLFAHSMYHLIGYDHMTPEEAAVMEKKQSALLDSLGITRKNDLPDGGVRSDAH